MDLRIITGVFISFFTLMNCSETGIQSDIEPGTRDYQWSIDTINTYPAYRLWGSSKDDIWVISSGGSLSESIYHFNGNEWSTDGIFRLISPRSIWGFSKNNVYIGGMNGKIWQYDGNNWKENATLTKDGHLDIVFDNLWGESKNDIFVSGAYVDSNGYANNSVIAHYSGSWEMVNTNGIIGIVERVFKNREDNKIFVLTYRFGAGQFPDSSLIFEYANEEYLKLYGNIWTQGLQADLSIINKKVYFIMGNKISIRIDNQFEEFLDVGNPNFYQRIWGTNSKNIFMLMTDGLVHYNGTDTEYLFYFSNTRTQVFGAALFEDDIFFLVNDSPTKSTLVYHGTIK